MNLIDLINLRMVERRSRKAGGGAPEPAPIIPEKNEAVKVAIRCRPLNETEVLQGHTKIVHINRARGEITVAKG